VDEKWMPNNEIGGWSRDTTIEVRKILENKRATMGCMTQETNA
jgi:hypothetical protein